MSIVNKQVRNSQFILQVTSKVTRYSRLKRSRRANSAKERFRAGKLPIKRGRKTTDGAEHSRGTRARDYERREVMRVGKLPIERGSNESYGEIRRGHEARGR